MVLAAASATTASAAITYTLTGDATGAVLDNSFNVVVSFDTVATTFDFQGDFGKLAFGGILSGAHLNGGTVTAAGLTADVDFASNGGFAAVQFIPFAAFGSLGDVFGFGGHPPIVFSGPGIDGYDGRSTLTATAVDIFGPDGTDGFGLFGIHYGGSSYILAVDHFSNAYFSAEGSVSAGVPEPAAWGLMIFGFGLAGAALRRRRALALA
ncbi:MAG TPA: PEPxxWA-CTERM sorting domain-containing protein [Phenylobacterium sp.]